MNSLLAKLGRDFRTGFRTSALIRSAAVLLVAASAAPGLAGKDLQATSGEAPELVGVRRWINAESLTLADQKGKVVVLHFWAFSCINCQRNLPFYNQWRQDFAQDKVQIIGVHTPETADEADPENVVNHVKKLGIKYPVALDNDRGTWEAYQNRYWPSVYLIDKRGRLRARWEGELEYRKAGGDRVLRAKIKDLLNERAE